MVPDLAAVEARLGTDLIPRETFEAFLDEYIRTQHPQINHPWVQMLFRGELTHDDLRVHALQFEHFLRFAPSHFLMIGANAEPHTIPGPDDMRRDAVILACASKNYFADALKQAGANPLLWTTNLMAPEAYVLKAAVDGWLAGAEGEEVRERAAKAYDSYQSCGLNSARTLFASGW